MAKTYLQIVNDAILESGTDLDQFLPDGSDFNATGHDSLMYKFKTWVARAWQTVQQDAYDWQFMSEQAVVNINPGIMFYTNDTINWSAEQINPVIIYDVDGTPKILGNTATRVKDLTGIYTDQEKFGYIDLFCDTSSPLSFGMKSGGEYFLTPSAGVSSSMSFNSPGPVPAVGDTLTIVAASAAEVIGVQFLVDSVSGSTFTLEGVSIQDNLLMLEFYSVVSNSIETVQDQNGVIYGVNSYQPPVWQASQAASTNLYMAGFWYTDVGAENFIAQNSVIETLTIDNTTTSEFFSFTNPGTASFVSPSGAVLPTSGALYLQITQEVANTIAALDPTQSIKFRLVTADTNVFATSVSEAPMVISFVSAPKKNYIHSWKSFDWAEETQDDDFVEEVAEIDEDSFRLVTHEIPAPGLEIKLPFMHWELFRMRYDNATVPPNQPRIVTKDSVGRWRFYPSPDVPYTILFDYVRNPQKLTNFGDIPKGLPDDFSDLVMWRALMYYGDYDEQPSVTNRATKNYKDMLFRLELRFRDKFHLQPYKLW